MLLTSVSDYVAYCEDSDAIAITNVNSLGIRGVRMMTRSFMVTCKSFIRSGWSVSVKSLCWNYFWLHATSTVYFTCKSCYVRLARPSHLAKDLFRNVHASSVTETFSHTLLVMCVYIEEADDSSHVDSAVSKPLISCTDRSRHMSSCPYLSSDTKSSW